MLWILIIGVFMGLVSAAFWCMEFTPFLKAIESLKPPNHKNHVKCFIQSLQYTTGFITSLSRLWALGIDLFCTVWLTSVFGFTGMIGCIIGLSISNVISIFLLTKLKKIHV